MSRSTGKTERLVIGHGPCDVERRLLDDLRAVLRARTDQAPWRPILVVTASATLRRHFLAVMARELGGSVIGVSVKTAGELSRDILRRHGVQPVVAPELEAVFVRRAVAAEPELATALSPFADGLGLVASSVSDLLSAGIECVDGPRLDTLFDDLRASAAVSRARALARVALATRRALDAAGLARHGDVMRRASVVLASAADPLVREAAVFIHGFADAPGTVSEFLRQLLRQAGGRLYLDCPFDPTDVTELDRGCAFVQRFLERLVGVAPSPRPTSAVPAVRLHTTTAVGDDGEVGVAARQIARWIAAGSAPESIGVVARRLDPYVVPIRRWFTALGIPFSGGRLPARLDPRARAARSLAAALQRRFDTGIDTFCDMLGPEVVPSGDAGAGDIDLLRLALRAAGAARIRDVAAMDWATALGDADSMALPVRGHEAGAAADNAGETDVAAPRGGDAADAAPPRRRVARRVLQEATRKAAAFVTSLDTWPASATVNGHLDHLEGALVQGLGWPAVPTDASADPRQAVVVLRDVAWRDTVLSFEEFCTMVVPILESSGEAEAGGAGSGVQVLDVPHARALTFRHLVILGLNRGFFPRAVTDDPLLPDTIREHLAAVLPDLGLSRHGHDEERYLFAQCCGAAADIALSWQSRDAEGRETSRSTLLFGLEPPADGNAQDDARTRRPDPRAERPVLPADAAVAAGLAARGPAWSASLALALEDALERFADEASPGVVATRESAALAAQLAAADRRALPSHVKSEVAHPFLGWIGTVHATLDDGEAWPVTTLESAARCPWQTFLVKRLRLAPVPDADAALPDIDPSVIGIATHAALERLLDPGRGGGLERILGWRSGDRFVPQLGAERVESVVAEESARAARADGRLQPGMHRALARRVLPLVEHGLAILLAAGNDVEILAAEAEGRHEFELPGLGKRPVSFRSDRVERQGDVVRLVDYKTGSTFVTNKTADGRLKEIRRAIKSGDRLQAIVYAMATAEVTAGCAEGAYEFLGDDDAAGGRVAVAVPDDDLESACLSAVATVLGADEAGIVFPRLVEAKTPSSESHACSYCEVHPACRRHDTAARKHLVEWGLELERRRPRDDGETRFARAWHRSYETGAPPAEDAP